MLKNIAIIIGNKVIRIYEDINNEIKNFNLKKKILKIKIKIIGYGILKY